MILKLDGKEFNHFSSYDINLTFDAIASTFSFSALRDFAPKPFSYSECIITDDDGFRYITGTVINKSNGVTKKEQLVNISGYSLPGVLEDSTIPVSIYPLQSDKLTLEEIITKVLEPFGVGFNIDTFLQSTFRQKYEKSNAEPGEFVKAYINRLVSQRGVILTHDTSGNLVFTQIRPDKLQPVAGFEVGNPGVFEIGLTTDGQAMHSKITVLRQASQKTTSGLQATVTNPYVSSTREKTKILNSDSTNLQDIQAAARNELGNEIAQAINLKIKTTKLVLPGNTVKVTSGKLDLKPNTIFFVRNTNIKGDTESEVYELDCVPIDAYTQTDVKNIFQ